MIATCTHCGHTSSDVQQHLEYVGGKGIITTHIRCNDIIECWHRWDQQHGLPSPYYQGEITARESIRNTHQPRHNHRQGTLPSIDVVLDGLDEMKRQKRSTGK